jgi:solute carrier family 25 (mitochondrial phosphate transporter), member 23/24/25/41
MNGETANAQAARLEALWSKLDTRNAGELDLAGLKKGLRKIDHRKRVLPESHLAH